MIDDEENKATKDSHREAFLLTEGEKNKSVDSVPCVCCGGLCQIK